MGSGTLNKDSFANYSRSVGRTYDSSTGRVSGKVYTSTYLQPELDPKNVIRECCISDEHPNPIPVIIGLDVTGSMGSACKEVAEALGVIMGDLYSKYKDIEFLFMGIGELGCVSNSTANNLTKEKLRNQTIWHRDTTPIQATQFESDIRIAKQLDMVYLEGGGCGNGNESYTAAWFFGLNNTKLEPYDIQGRKGIIITLGDEGLNPYLPKNSLNSVLGCNVENNILTDELYEQASKKFEIFHIAVDHPSSSYKYYKLEIHDSFPKVIGEKRLKVSTIDSLALTICDCIDEALGNNTTTSENNDGGISGIPVLDHWGD